MAKEGVVLKQPPVVVPQSVDEATVSMEELGRIQREMKQVATETDAQIADITKQGEEKLRSLRDRLIGLFYGLRDFAKARRQELTKGGKKTVNFFSGDMSWKMTPPRVEIKDEKELKRYLQEQGLSQFLKTEITLDREAMLKDVAAASKLPGVTIEQQEEFHVKPKEGTGKITESMLQKLLKALS